MEKGVDVFLSLSQREIKRDLRSKIPMKPPFSKGERLAGWFFSTLLDEQPLQEFSWPCFQCDLCYLMKPLIKADSKPFAMKLMPYVRVLELIVTIAADYNKVSRMMTFRRVKVMYLKIRLLVFFEKPEIAHLTMSAVDFLK